MPWPIPEHTLLKMLRSIKNYFQKNIQDRADDAGSECSSSLELATTALLLEVARSDFNVQDEELRSVSAAVCKTFNITKDQGDELVSLAEEEAKQAACLYEFTQLVDKSFGDADKSRIIELMWQVAYVDGVLDKYEDHLIRKVADLIHVSHSEFIKAKHRAREPGS